jgi:gamma-glutamylcyclotransferase (GGCT)/AIG2-like uncharacterized protein YtfP
VPALTLFVYGTLKRGERNHLRYADGFQRAEAGEVSGRLYDLPAGYPILTIPPESILALGTSSPEEDARTQAAWAERLRDARAAPLAIPLTGLPAADHWPRVSGDLFSYDDPRARIPDMDRLEDFNPGGRSLYLRVLVRAIHPAGIPVWVYVAPEGELPPGARPIEKWP